MDPKVKALLLAADAEPDLRMVRPSDPDLVTMVEMAEVLGMAVAGMRERIHTLGVRPRGCIGGRVGGRAYLYSAAEVAEAIRVQRQSRIRVTPTRIARLQDRIRILEAQLAEAEQQQAKTDAEKERQQT